MIQTDPTTVASNLMRYHDERGDDWADTIDMLTMHPEAHRRVVRMLSEIDASESH